MVPRKVTEKLIDLYEGNPLYLKDIAVLIKDIFNGYVDDFMAENNLIITKNMQFNLSQVFNRLSSIEQQIVLALSKFNQPAQREDIKLSNFFCKVAEADSKKS